MLNNRIVIEVTDEKTLNARASFEHTVNWPVEPCGGASYAFCDGDKATVAGWASYALGTGMIEGANISYYNSHDVLIRRCS